ncbi:MAG TPA: hypothetical protein VEA80_07300 [Vitreimonas sp.]|uniref:hypothetical protein n=1 Tax=Vitreimonas sp. TaxID=3069702 RepID=UPI002D4E0AD6|nr:hypothetical protein [Vitreimonas sp.]HYD87263.1 hypothetical protein [Vitreimonas sp.]
MAKPLLITAGDVIEVQLTSETVVFDRGDGAAQVEPGHITNRMRLFVRELDGRENKYDFEDTELGVRETQRVAIVRGAAKGARQPVNLMLFNLSSGESDAFERGLRAFLGEKPFFNAFLKAVAIALGIVIVFWLTARFGLAKTIAWANVYSIMTALLLFPLLWWGAAQWDKLTREWRYQNLRKRLIADATGRVRAYLAPPASSPAAALKAAPPQQA